MLKPIRHPRPFPWLLALALALPGAAAWSQAPAPATDAATPPAGLQAQIEKMSNLAKDLNSQMAALQSDMTQFNDTSGQVRAGGASGEAADPLIKGLRDLKVTVYAILEQTDLNSDFMDAVEATTSEVRLRRERAQGFQGQSRDDLIARWDTELKLLQQQKDGITRTREQARDNLTLLGDQEAVLAELNALDQVGAITDQLKVLFEGLQELSQSMQSVAATADPLRGGASVPTP